MPCANHFSVPKKGSNLPYLALQSAPFACCGKLDSNHDEADGSFSCKVGPLPVISISRVRTPPIRLITPVSHLSNEKNPGWLGDIGDYTTQLYRDYNKPL